jgi:cytochrome c oxidase cbb3-type subunit 2
MFLESSAQAKILLAIAAAGCGIAASFFLRSEPARPSSLLDYDVISASTWIGLFLVLVSLDFAAFYIIEHNSALYVKSWESAVILEGNAFVHLCVALLTGFALDRRWPAVSVAFALALLIGSCLLLNGYSRQFPPARVLYTAGVSIYATALVYLPARGGRRWFSGSLFAIAGWLGSVLGLGLALRVRQIPVSLLAFAAVVAALMLFARFLWLRSREAAALDGPT